MPCARACRSVVVLPGGVDSAQDDAGRLEGQRQAEGGGLPLDGCLAVKDAQRPADRPCRLLSALRHPGDAAVGEIGGYEDDQAWTLRGRPALRAAVVTGRLQSASDHGLRPPDGRIGGAQCSGMAGASGRGKDQGCQQRRHDDPDPAPSHRARRADASVATTVPSTMISELTTPEPCWDSTSRYPGDQQRQQPRHQDQGPGQAEQSAWEHPRGHRGQALPPRGGFVFADRRADTGHAPVPVSSDVALMSPNGAPAAAATAPSVAPDRRQAPITRAAMFITLIASPAWRQVREVTNTCCTTWILHYPDSQALTP